MVMVRSLLLSSFLLAPVSASFLAAQAVEQPAGKPLYAPSLIQTAGDALAGITIASLPGIPFTATVDIENQFQSLDGKVRIERLNGKIARDSQGSTRVVVDLNVLGAARNPTQVTIHIFDAPRKADIVMFPAARQAILNFEEDQPRAAHHPLPYGKQLPPLRISPAPSVKLSPSEPIHVEREDLGVDILDRTELRHGRETTHLPASSTSDHKPATVVMDYWYAQDLQAFVRIERLGPGPGRQTIVLRDIRREPPPASLFRIPVGYHVETTYPEESLMPGICPVP